MLALSAYDTYLDQLFDVMKRFTGTLAQAGIEYGVIGGMAVFLHVNERDTMAARLTRDIDAAVERADLPAIIRAVEPFGFTHQHVDGADTLVDTPNRRREAQSTSFSWMKKSVPGTWSPYRIFHLLCRHRMAF